MFQTFSFACLYLHYTRGRRGGVWLEILNNLTRKRGVCKEKEGPDEGGGVGKGREGGRILESL